MIITSGVLEDGYIRSYGNKSKGLRNLGILDCKREIFIFIPQDVLSDEYDDKSIVYSKAIMLNSSASRTKDMVFDQIHYRSETPTILLNLYTFSIAFTKSEMRNIASYEFVLDSANSNSTTIFDNGPRNKSKIIVNGSAMFSTSALNIYPDLADYYLGNEETGVCIPYPLYYNKTHEEFYTKNFEPLSTIIGEIDFCLIQGSELIDDFTIIKTLKREEWFDIYNGLMDKLTEYSTSNVEINTSFSKHDNSNIITDLAHSILPANLSSEISGIFYGYDSTNINSKGQVVVDKLNVPLHKYQPNDVISDQVSTMAMRVTDYAKQVEKEHGSITLKHYVDRFGGKTKIEFLDYSKDNQPTTGGHTNHSDAIEDEVHVLSLSLTKDDIVEPSINCWEEY